MDPLKADVNKSESCEDSSNNDGKEESMTSTPTASVNSTNNTAATASQEESLTPLKGNNVHVMSPRGKSTLNNSIINLTASSQLPLSAQ